MAKSQQVNIYLSPLDEARFMRICEYQRRSRSGLASIAVMLFVQEAERTLNLSKDVPERYWVASPPAEAEDEDSALEEAEHKEAKPKTRIVIG